MKKTSSYVFIRQVLVITKDILVIVGLCLAIAVKLHML